MAKIVNMISGGLMMIGLSALVGLGAVALLAFLALSLLLAGGLFALAAPVAGFVAAGWTGMQMMAELNGEPAHV